MSLSLYAHPFSSYCWKALIALHENGTPFCYRRVDDPGAAAELAALWPLGRFPVLVDEGEPTPEATAIVERLALRHPGPARLVPEDPEAALRARLLDRIFDNYVMTPMQKIVGDRLRAASERDALGVAEARRTLDAAYGWLDGALGAPWALGEPFTLADCAAAPSLFYADWVHPIPEARAALRAYRARLLARPSVVRCVEEARPFRPNFPGGAPDRD